MCREDLRICFCLNRVKPWLKLSFKFNQCIMRPWVSMSKITSPYFQIETWAIIFFQFSFLINFRMAYIWPIYQNLENTIWFTILFYFFFIFFIFFFILKRVRLCSKIWFFSLNYELLFPIGFIKDIIAKMYHKYVNEKLWPYHLSFFINSCIIWPIP